MAAKHPRSGKELDWHPRLLPALRVLVGVALAISAYLAWFSLTHGKVAGCGPESGCDAVLKSRWAYWLGIPVSLPALAVYASLLGGTFRLRPGLPAESRRWIWRLLIVLAVMIAGAALWFIFLQLVLIKRICPFCMVAHGCGLVGAVLILKGGPIRPPSEIAWQREKQVYVPPEKMRGLVFAGVAGVVFLVAGQCLQPFQAFVVKSLAGGRTAAPTPERILTLHDGLFRFNLRETPLMGSADATNVMVSLFDYTCSHCQQVHPRLVEAQRAFSNRLAVLSLPMPLDSNCNTTLKYQPRPHIGACQFAQLSLAVWRADRTKHRQFDDWLFATNPPRPIAAARVEAAQLVGSNALATALADPWITNLIAQSVSLYATNWAKLRVGTLPELMIGSNVLSGEVSATNIFQQLERQFGLTR